MEIIHLVEHSNLSVKKTLEELQVPRSTFTAGISVIRNTGWMV
jgi:hypothetical protein